MADQGVASSTNFLLNVFLVRWLAPREYGAYAVCWSILLVLAGFHNALILEPMTVVGPAEYKSQLNDYLGSAQRLNWPVIWGLALVTVVIGFAYRQPVVRTALFVMSACVPGYLLLLVARRRQYVLNRPSRALQLSLLYALLVLAVIVLFRTMGRLSSTTAVMALGVAWLVGGAFLPKSDHSLEIKVIAHQHWRYGKWLFASAILAIGVSDMQTILLSMLVDLRSAGALRALMNFVLPLSQLLTVLSVYALPRLSGRAKEWGAQKLLTDGLLFPAAMVCIIAFYLGALILFAPQLEHLLYGGNMRTYIKLVPLLAASALAAGIGASFSTPLRAVQNSQHQFVAGVSGTAIGVICAFYLLRRLGISGALWSMFAANTASTLIIIATYLRLMRRSVA